MRSVPLWNLLALGGIALAAYAQQPAEIPPLAGFAGDWTLNEELSDDAQQKLSERVEGRRPGGFRPPPGGGPSGGPGPMGAPAGRDAPESVRAVFEPAAELTISVRGDEIEIQEAYGRTRRLRPNGKSYKTENGLAELKTRWENGELRVETKRGPRGKVEERWTLSPDRSRIEIEVKAQLGFGPDLSVRRVYDRAAREEGSLLPGVSPEVHVSAATRARMLP